MRVVSERRIWRDEVYLEVYPDHLAPVHQLERTRIADFCPRMSFIELVAFFKNLVLIEKQKKEKEENRLL